MITVPLLIDCTTFFLYSKGHCWAASELMHAGAAVRVITTNGRTPMFVAAEKGLGEMIRIMVEDCHVSDTI